MNRVIVLVIVLVMVMSAGAQANNYVFGTEGSSLESEGYKLFISDRILNTVDKIDAGAGVAAEYCKGTDEIISKNLGDIGTLRSDTRLSIGADTKISYSDACHTYYSVLERFKGADDIRRLWLLFGDSATDSYVVETQKSKGITEDAKVLIEMKRLGVVAKYIDFFTKNKEWKLTGYTFLSQAFKSLKNKPLSPAYSQFITALLTGDTARAFQVVKSIDLDNLGNRFIVPGTSASMKK